MDEQTQQLQREVRTMAGSRWSSQAVYAARDLGVPHALATQTLAADEVASEIGAQPDAKARLLRALATLGIVEAVGTREFSLTPLGSLLRADGSDSVRGSIMLALGPGTWRERTENEYSSLLGRAGFEVAAIVPTESGLDVIDARRV
jgi:hypothetical protein